MPGEHELRIALATALRERDEALSREAGLARANAALADSVTRCSGIESERDALRTALQDIVTLCMDVPATEDWRAKVGDKARAALFGPPAWERK